MFLIYGRRTARLKKYKDHHQACSSCRAFDLDVEVSRDYYHLFYVPIFPVGDKSVTIRCHDCGEPNRLTSSLEYYRRMAKTPFYLYTLLILFGIVVFIGINLNIATQKKKAKYVDNPQIGDLYTIRSNENNQRSYYFLLVVDIRNDTLVLHHNLLEYFRYPSQLADEDYFVKEEEIYFTKNELKLMLKKDEINDVDRDSKYSNRVR